MRDVVQKYRVPILCVVGAVIVIAVWRGLQGFQHTMQPGGDALVGLSLHINALRVGHGAGTARMRGL